MSINKDRETLGRQYLLKLKTFFPKSFLFYYVFFIFKILPIIILTHDWNLNYGVGISHILNQFTLGPIASKINNRKVIISIVIIIFIVTIISMIINIICKIKLFKYKKLRKPWKSAFHLNTLYAFLVYFIFSQQLYIFIIETLFDTPRYVSDKDYNLIDTFVFRGNINIYSFYIIFVFEIIMILISLLVSYLILALYFEPYYSSHSCLVNNFGSVNINWIIFSLSQLVNQLELHLPFKSIIIVKAICRGIYVVYFIYFICKLRTFFYSNHKINTLILFALSMCFISSVIEFMFLYDYNNNLIILTSNMNYILFKFFIETLLSLVIICYINHKETKTLILIEAPINKEAFTIYSLYNKVFYFLSNPNSNRTLLVKIFHAFYIKFCEHQSNCKTKTTGCYCNAYIIDTFYNQSYKFLFVYDNQKAKVSGEKKNLKDQFPSFYSFIEYSLIQGIKNKNSVISNQYLLLSVLFYLEFDKNINKSYYFLEEYMKSTQYRKSLICKIQVQLLRKYIKSKFYNSLKKSNDVVMKKHYKHFKNIIHYIHIENSIKIAFDVYNNFIYKCSNHSLRYDDFCTQIKILKKNISINKDFFINYFQNEKCLHLHLCAELTLYYNFFYNEIPEDISLCFMKLTKLEELLKFESSKQIIISFSNLPNSLFIIDYASHTLIQDLKFSSSKEIKHKSLKEIVLTNFSSSYESYLKEEVHKGNTSIYIPYLSLITIDSSIRIYSLKALVIIMGDTLKIFGTLISFEDQILSEYNKDKIDEKELSIKPCYSITKSNGRIIGINDEFRKYFFFNFGMIFELKLNIYKDILKITPPKTNPNKLYIKPHTLYSNLLDIHEEAMLENNSTNYHQIFIQLKDIICKLTKYPILQHFILNYDNITITDKRKSKNYYLIYFSIEGEKKMTLSSFDIFMNGNNQNQNTTKNNNTINGNNHRNSTCLNYRIFREYNIKLVFQYMSNKNDIIEKLALIKLQALKVLFYKFKINGNIIEQFIQKKIDFDADQEFIFNNYTKEMRRKLNIKSSLIYQFILMLIVLIIFLISIILIIVYDKQLYKEVENIINCGLYFLLTKKQITSLTNIVLNLQLKANGIMGDTIDSNFPNENQVIVELLQMKLEDYTNFFKQFIVLFKSPYNNNNINLVKVNEISEVNYFYIVLNSKLQSEHINETLSNSLYYLHYKISRIIRQGYLNPLLFNNTNEKNITSYYPKYFIDNPEFTRIGSDLFNPEKSSVFLIENSILNLRYPFAECINIMDITTKEKINSSMFFLLIMCFVNSMILLILFVYQLFYYYCLYQKIFCKAFLNFCYVQYFNLLLLKKTYLLKNFIEIATIETVMKTILTRVQIQNNEIESGLISSKTEQIDYDYQYEITPFQVYEKEISIKEYIGVDIPNSVSEILNSKKRLSVFNSIKMKNLISNNNENSTNDQKVKRFKNQASSLLKSMNTVRKSIQFTSTDMKNRESQLQITPQQESNNFKTSNISTNNKTAIYNDTLGTNQSLISLQNQSQLDTDKVEHHHGNKNENMFQKPSMLCIIILFSAFCFFSFTISFIFFYIFTEEYKLLRQYTEIQQASLIRIDTFHESFLGYSICLIKNRQIFVDYNSLGYLLNQNQTHEVVIDMLNDFEYFNKKFISLFNNNKEISAFNVHTVEYDNILNSENFCQLSGEYMKKVNQTTKGIKFNLINVLSNEEFNNICVHAGKGFNSKGFYNAIIGLIIYIRDSYTEFSQKKDRNDKYIYEKLTEFIMETYNVETTYLLDFVYTNFHYAITEDYYSKLDELNIYLFLCLVIVVLCLFIVSGIYGFKLTKKLVEDVDSLEQIEALIYHTIVF